MKTKYLLFPLFLLCSFLLACSPTPTVATVSVMDIEPTATEVPAPCKMDATSIQENGWIIRAIEKHCECELDDFINIGVIWKRNGEQMGYIPSIGALNRLDVAGSLFTVHKGDTILYGTTTCAAENAEAGVMTATMSQDTKERFDQLRVSGGDLQEEIVLRYYWCPENVLTCDNAWQTLE